MEKVRIGLVGTGFISEWHYNGFAGNKNAEIVGICAHAKTERLAQRAAEWNIKAYDSFDEMVCDPNIDALVIGSRNTEHFSQAMAAIENHKHILVEKPVVTELADLDALKQAAYDKNVVVFPGHNFVYRESIRQAKEIILDGGLGKVYYASFASTHTISTDHATGWRGNLALSKGGALMDSGHHLVYMSLFLRGMPQKLQAFKSNLVLKEMEGEDIAQVNLLYPDQSVGSIMQSWTTGFETGVNGIKLFGDKGSIAITDALYWNDKKYSSDVEYADSFANQAIAFTDSIIKGKKPLSTLDDVKNTLSIIYGAYESGNNDIVKIF